MARIGAAIAAARATGTQQFETLLYAILADACLHARRAADGLAAAAQGLEIAQRPGERFCEAELLRLDGELTLAAAAAHMRCRRALGATVADDRAKSSKAFRKVLNEFRRGFLARTLPSSCTPDDKEEL